MNDWRALKPDCPKCGAPVAVPDGAAYARCGYCGSTAFVDLSGALLHQVIKPAIARTRVPGLVRARARDAGWPRISIAALNLVYEPVWELESEDGGRVRVGARPDPNGRFPLIKLPGGERAFVDTPSRGGDAEWLEPELAPESAAQVAARAAGRPIRATVTRLVHRPIYVGVIRVGGKSQDIRVDAVSGELMNVSWPVRPTFRRRDHAWSATALMVAAAALLPLKWAALAVLALGAIASREFSRKTLPPAGAKAATKR